MDTLALRMICMSSAPSCTLCANTVRQSNDAQAGTTPTVDTDPRVPFMPTQPQRPAGTRPAREMATEARTFMCACVRVPGAVHALIQMQAIQKLKPGLEPLCCASRKAHLTHIPLTYTQAQT
eukprot:951582-Pelagomonas_calceolata.AAC.1